MSRQKWSPKSQRNSQVNAAVGGDDDGAGGRRAWRWGMKRHWRFASMVRLPFEHDARSERS